METYIGKYSLKKYIPIKSCERKILNCLSRLVIQWLLQHRKDNVAKKNDEE